MSSTTLKNEIFQDAKLTPGLLRGKSAIIYGGAGGIGSEVARVFAKEGATVFLVGRTLETLERVARDIINRGGSVETAQLDAYNSKEVEAHVQKVIERAGKLDISFNLISTDVGMGSALTELSEQDFNQFAFNHARTLFITATAAARQMEKQGSGVILALTAAPARIPEPNIGGFSIACASIEALCRQLALEVGPRGVRVVYLRTGGTPDNPVLDRVYNRLAEVRGISREEVEKAEAVRTALKRLPRVAEVAKTAAIIASDYASAITATAVNASCGDIVD
jgi:3-oxoacyl-[acyl-carrier protein] reductase